MAERSGEGGDSSFAVVPATGAHEAGVSCIAFTVESRMKQYERKDTECGVHTVGHQGLASALYG